MKYETPELTALTPAINAIQSVHPETKPNGTQSDNLVDNEINGAYADWE
jgi:hypothetical protein